MKSFLYMLIILIPCIAFSEIAPNNHYYFLLGYTGISRVSEGEYSISFYKNDRNIINMFELISKRFIKSYKLEFDLRNKVFIEQIGSQSDPQVHFYLFNMKHLMNNIYDYITNHSKYSSTNDVFTTELVNNISINNKIILLSGLYLRFGNSNTLAIAYYPFTVNTICELLRNSGFSDVKIITNKLFIPGAPTVISFSTNNIHLYNKLRYNYKKYI